jgi:hypothetical protein
MTEIIEQTEPIARKDHDCMACEWLVNSDIIDYLTFSEKRAVVRAKRNGWKIKKGQQYIRQFNKGCGEVWVFKAIPEIHDICLEYDLYEDC